MVVSTPAEIMDVLRRLQAIDDEIREIRVARDQMVSSMERLQKVLSHLDRELAEKREKLAEAETWYRAKNGELENEREKLSKAKSKLTGVTRSKEYVAVNKELETVRKNITQREDEVAKLLVAIGEFREAIGKEEQKVKDLRSQAEVESHSNRERLAVMEGKIAEVDGRRKVISAAVDHSVVERYARIAAKRGGIAVAPVVDGGCRGCHMQLNPRFIESILRASSVVMCPHCSRYLYAESGHDADGNAVTAV